MTDWDRVDFGGIVCRQFGELVTDYLEGRLDPKSRARFKQHLAACPGCARCVDQIRATTTILGRVALDPISDEARDQLLDAFRAWRAAGTDRTDAAQEESAGPTAARHARGRPP